MESTKGTEEAATNSFSSFMAQPNTLRCNVCQAKSRKAFFNGPQIVGSRGREGSRGRHDLQRLHPPRSERPRDARRVGFDMSVPSIIAAFVRSERPATAR